jgi:hypothetical protein
LQRNQSVSLGDGSVQAFAACSSPAQGVELDVYDSQIVEHG